MLLDKVFEPFIQETPICVMARATLQRILDPQHLDQLFARTAQRQYTNELLFSSLVDLMTRVVLGQEPSVHAAYRQARRPTPGQRPIRLQQTPARRTRRLGRPRPRLGPPRHTRPPRPAGFLAAVAARLPGQVPGRQPSRGHGASPAGATRASGPPLCPAWPWWSSTRSTGRSPTWC